MKGENLEGRLIYDDDLVTGFSSGHISHICGLGLAETNLNKFSHQK